MIALTQIRFPPEGEPLTRYDYQMRPIDGDRFVELLYDHAKHIPVNAIKRLYDFMQDIEKYNDMLFRIDSNTVEFLVEDMRVYDDFFTLMESWELCPSRREWGFLRYTVKNEELHIHKEVESLRKYPQSGEYLNHIQQIQKAEEKICAMEHSTPITGTLRKTAGWWVPSLYMDEELYGLEYLAYMLESTNVTDVGTGDPHSMHALVFPHEVRGAYIYGALLFSPAISFSRITVRP
jgi:hypothetical protein